MDRTMANRVRGFAMAYQNRGDGKESFIANLARLEFNICKYARSQNADDNIVDLSEDIQSIKIWAEEQNAHSQKNSRNQRITNVGNAIATTVRSLDSLSSEKPYEVMKGCLSITTSIAFVAGGPYGAAVEAVSHVLATILSIHAPKRPNLATTFVEKVYAEILKLNQKLKSEKFSGLQARVRLMLINLRSLETQGDLPDDKILYETDFPQFIGEVAHNFSHGLNPDSKDEDVHDCLTSMVAYCHAVTSFLVLLSNVLVTFQAIGNNTECIVRLLNDQIRDAFEKLEYLSYFKTYSLAMSPNDKRKLYLAFRLRNNHIIYEIVEEFRLRAWG
ncbi:toxin CaTX-A-like [Dendronephthya gigantea]|uniref:toxin CaTX-A-like n=1 Tax=Dendronephthya gigantea TaxID=151771 RepID=UPI001069CDE7|nr:toxin CaTX-A-like [Dendronephthya gigantea]